jgi:putative transposase
MERKFTFSVGEYYHVYNRGVEKHDVFHDDSDRLRFQRMLHIANSDKPVVYKLIQRSPLDKIETGEKLTAIGAYCLMPNHFHLLVKETEEGGISKFMEKLTTGYSKYFNKKHNHLGRVFQGQFKAEHVDNDEYLKYLFAYIHLNPVKLIEPAWKETGVQDKKRAEEYLGRYGHSSYPDYMGNEREEKLILAKKEFPEYFNDSRDFSGYISDWLNYRDEPELH